jgi:hypothetical protein
MQPSRRRAASVLLLTVALFIGSAAGSAGCARTDLGAPCHLQDVNGAELRPQAGREYLYLGSSECESFACLATPGTPGGYCSQACSGPGASCPSGLVCHKLTLDEPYLGAMKVRLPPDRFSAIFGQLNSSYFCAKP